MPLKPKERYFILRHKQLTEYTPPPSGSGGGGGSAGLKSELCVVKQIIAPTHEEMLQQVQQYLEKETHAAHALTPHYICLVLGTYGKEVKTEFVFNEDGGNG